MPFDDCGRGCSARLDGLNPVVRLLVVLRRRGQKTWWRGQSVWRTFLRNLAPPVETTEEAIAILLLARKLLRDPAHWAQGTYRTNDHRYCAIGAMRAVTGGRFGRNGDILATRLLRIVAWHQGYSCVEEMNDLSTHQQVLAAFDRAVALGSETGSCDTMRRLLWNIGTNMPVLGGPY